MRDTVTFVVPGVMDMEFPKAARPRVRGYFGPAGQQQARDDFFTSVGRTRPDAELSYIVVAPMVIWQDYAVSSVASAAWVQTDAALRFSQLSTAITMAWELSFPTVLVLWWLRQQPTRGAWVRRWRPDLALVTVGALFHVGIAIWLELGVFPYAMLALYPAFVAPSEWEALHDAIRRRDLSLLIAALAFAASAALSTRSNSLARPTSRSCSRRFRTSLCRWRAAATQR
jgi:hypothetical protein